MNLKEIQDNAPERATHYYKVADKVIYYKEYSGLWAEFNNDDLLVYADNKKENDRLSESLLPLYPTPKEILKDEKTPFYPALEDDIHHTLSNCLSGIDTLFFKTNQSKEKEEMKKYGEYKETSYNCGATSSAKISVNSGNHTTADILNERQEQYGCYTDVARITQEIKESLASGDSYHVLSDEQKLSLDMIANKMARAVNGNVRYVDNWADICGYSQLVVDSLKKEG